MGLLADLFVKFSAQGTSAVAGALKTVQTGFNACTAAATVGSTALLGFASAGLASSAEGERIGQLMGLLSREIGSLFLPAIDLGTKALSKLVGWFQSLNQEQFSAISGFAMAGTAATAFGAAGFALGGPLGAVAGAIVGIISGLGLMASQTEKGKAAFEKLWQAGQRVYDALGPPLLEAVTSLAETLADLVIPAVEELAHWLGKMADELERVGLTASRTKSAGGHRTLGAMGGGVEQVTQTYTRIQAAALKQPGEDHQKRIAENTSPNTLLETFRSGIRLMWQQYREMLPQLGDAVTGIAAGAIFGR